MGAAVGDDRRGEHAGGGVVGEILLPAVPGHGNGRLGQDAVHGVRNRGGEKGTAGGHRDGGYRIVHHAVIGEHHLVQINGTISAVGVQADIRFTVDCQSLQFLDTIQIHRNLFPAGEIQSRYLRFQPALGTVTVQQRQCVAGVVAINPEIQKAVRRHRHRILKPHLRHIASAGIIIQIQRIAHFSGAAAQADILAPINAFKIRAIAKSVENRVSAFKIFHRLECHL